MKKMLSLLLVLALCIGMVPAAFADETAKITVFHYMVEGQKADGLVQIEEAFKAANAAK